MKRFFDSGKYFLLIIFLLLVFSRLLSAGEDENNFVLNHFWGQELLIQLPAFNKPNLFGSGIGGSFIYELYILNKLFNPQRTLPGIVLGLTGSLFNFMPEDVAIDNFGDSALFNAGAYLGYQFYFPVSGNLSFSPAITAGARYYFNFHYYNATLYPSSNLIITGGLNFNFIINRICNLAACAEYEFYYESEPAHTLQFALRTGFFL